MSPLTLDDLRSRLAGRTGRHYWRSLEEIAESPAFTDLLHREFPRQASEWMDAVSRRQFLHVMAASLALAGLASCAPRNPAETIVPYVKAPEGFTPGRPLFYATGVSEGGVTTGLLVKSHMGRPIKIDGNERHPSSLGATSATMQASILTMYDPDRSQTVVNLGEVRPWASFVTGLKEALAAQKASKGAGLRILTETIGSPTAADQLSRVLAAFPEAKWHQYEPVNRDQALAGSLAAFGEAVDAHYNLTDARVIVSLDSDFLFEGRGHLRMIRDFARSRRVRTPEHGGGATQSMNRLYVAESSFSNTGSRADHRVAVRPDAIDAIAREIARGVGVAGATGGGALDPKSARWVQGVVADLRKAGGASVVLAGDHQPAAVHALAHAINIALGSVGRTVFLTEPITARPENQLESLTTLCRDMDAGRVQLLLILGGNPVYTAPADLRFAQCLDKVALRARLGLYEDETSELCHWHIPETHFLEAWSDGRGWDGTMNIVQPLIAPLYEGKSIHEFLAVLTDETSKSGYDLVRDVWKKRIPAADFDRVWSETVHDGILAGSGALPVTPTLRDAGAWSAAEPTSGTVLALRPDPSIFDGRWANNGWLQEVSKPITRLTWENVAIVSPKLAQALHVKNGDFVEVSASGEKANAPIWILPGQPEDVVTVHLGFGRTRAGRVGTGVGFDANRLRTAAAWHWVSGVSLKKTGKKTLLACTQDHQSMEGRFLVRSASLEEHRKNPHWAHEVGAEAPPRDETLYPNIAYNGNAWGLAVDLTSCVGCNACVVACQAENNVPVVGKTQVWRGREMAWIRIDRYFEGDLDDPELHYQPVMCMQCENAPCEGVCPVAATTHNAEGLNDMAYNRCVGTRYCSNNCPYKVRRFNFLQFTDLKTPQMKLLNNPEVTVRTRGVMEKCTYCVQRINAVRIEAHKANRPIRDGEIVTACQQVCPAEAIVFGDINDPESQVGKMKADPLNYAILADLNTRPRTSYLARLANPNPDMETA